MALERSHMLDQAIAEAEEREAAVAQVRRRCKDADLILEALGLNED